MTYILCAVILITKVFCFKNNLSQLTAIVFSPKKSRIFDISWNTIIVSFDNDRKQPKYN